MGRPDDAELLGDHQLRGCAGHRDHAVPHRPRALPEDDPAGRPQPAAHPVPADRPAGQRVPDGELAVPAPVHHGHAQVAGLPCHDRHQCRPPDFHMDAPRHHNGHPVGGVLLPPDDGPPQHAGRRWRLERREPRHDPRHAEPHQRVHGHGGRLPPGGRRHDAHVGRQNRGQQLHTGRLRRAVLRANGLRPGGGHSGDTRRSLVRQDCQHHQPGARRAPSPLHAAADRPTGRPQGEQVLCVTH
mmetsp:Transcript_68205/g.192284  ORF Transcript_68205/g.192284 Transcript_68205/m.192284 type:complete len:242 (-) Transcript_68205:390-1115(-)